MDRGLITALLLSVTLAGAVGLVYPEYLAVQKLKVVSQERSDILEGAQRASTKVNSLTQDYNNSEDPRRRLDIALPDEVRADVVIANLEGLVRQSGMELGNVTIGSSAPVVEGIDGSDISFELSGSYEQMYSLLELLESSVQIYEIKKMDLGVADEESSNPFKMGVTFTVYSMGVSKSTNLMPSPGATSQDTI